MSASPRLGAPGSRPLLVLVLAAVGSRAIGGPITSDTALPIHAGEVLVRAQATLTRATGDPTPMDRRLTVWAAPTVLVYGVTERLALFAVAPYVRKTLRATARAGRRTRGDDGLGDVRVFGRYTLGQWDRPRETVRLAPLLGLELPTGDDDARDAHGRLPPPLQLGSGSFDPFVGLVVSWQTLGWELDGAVSYTANTEANGVDLGDMARLDLSYQYRVWPWFDLGPGVPAFLYAVAESSLRWRGRDRAGGRAVPDSGGTTWFLAPGLQYVARRMVLEAAVQLPAVQDLGGAALESDFILTTGVRLSF